MAKILDLHNLKWINLSKNRLVDLIPHRGKIVGKHDSSGLVTFLEAVQRGTLSYLNLSGNVIGHDVTSLMALIQLFCRNPIRRINITENNFSDSEALTIIEFLPSSSFDLCDLNHSIRSHELDLSKKGLKSYDGLFVHKSFENYLRDQSPTFSALSFESNPRFGDGGLDCLFNHSMNLFHQIDSLNLSKVGLTSCDMLTLKSFLISPFCKLRHLDLSYNRSTLDDEAIHHFCSGFRLNSSIVSLSFEASIPEIFNPYEFYSILQFKVTERFFMIISFRY